MRVLRRIHGGETLGEEILQPVLLLVGNGSDARRSNLRMVRGEVYGQERTGTAVLQPKLRGVSEIYPGGRAAREAEDQRGGAGGVEGQAEGGHGPVGPESEGSGCGWCAGGPVCIPDWTGRWPSSGTT